MCFNLRFYATVYSAASFSCVVSNWAGLTVTNGLNAARLNTVLAGQNLLNGVCTTLRQFLVVSVRTDGVSVTFNNGGGLWVLLHEVSEVLDVSVAVRLNDRLVEVELHVQLNTNNFSNRSFWFWSWLWNWSRSWSNLASVAAEVHTQTNQSGVVPLTVVHCVVGFNAGTSEQVVGEVVLNTGTDDSQGRLVATAVAVSQDVGTALVTETTRNVWTQGVHASLTEVVGSQQAAGVTFDLLVASAVVRTGVVGFVVVQVQRQVIGQEVADTSAWVEAVFDVLNAVVVLFL